MERSNDSFRKEIIRYLSTHWKEEITLESIAILYGYSPDYFYIKFKECFGIPFARFVRRLKLRGAAMQMIENGSLMNIGKEAGYGNPQSFSKAFRKEFGISPKQFLHSKEEVPDMPLERKIDGNPVQVIYVTEPECVLHGEIIMPVHGNNTNLLEETGYYYDHLYQQESSRDRDEIIEMWWHDDQCNIQCVVGKIDEEKKDAPEGMLKIVMPEDYYAVISVKYKKPQNTEEAERAGQAARELNRYAFEEWKIINGKKLRQMGYTFMKYKEDMLSVYIPVDRRDSVMKEEAARFREANAWIQYIDEHLDENLTVLQLAEAFHYSERHFTDTFEMYYSVRPGLYMKKRRLYLAARELRQGEQNLARLAESYGFSSLEAFQKGFAEEFLCRPEDYDGESYEVVNLGQYYVYHKKKLVFRYEMHSDFIMAGQNISLYQDQTGTEGNLIESIVWSLQRYSTEEVPETADAGNQIVVWQSAKEKRRHYCLVGPELKEDAEVPEKYQKIKIRGGYYIIMETPFEKDSDCLAESYRMLYRCAFGGWIRENQERIDLTRLTFVRYQGEKLQFYIPIYA